MRAGGKHLLGRAFGRLSREKRCRLARKAELDARFRERLEDYIDIGGPACREARDGVHVPLVHDDGAADRIEQTLGQGNIVVSGPGGDVRAEATVRLELE